MDQSSIIIPPLEVRNVIDKTSIFVAKNGLIFEERIYERERHNPKFSFLNPNDPYHKYYVVKTEDHKNGTDRISQLISKEITTAKATPAAPAEAKIVPKEPAPFEFRIPHPPIAPLDLDLMKCAALYVARNGRQFLSMLSIKEQKNVQFDFLKPSNILFSYFNKLVEMYTKIMQFPASLVQKLEACCDKFSLLDLLMERVEYEAWHNVQRQEEEAKREKEQRNLSACLNWQEFIVVESLTAPSTDDIASFELPISLNDLKALSLKDKAVVFDSNLSISKSIPDHLAGEKISTNPEPQVPVANISERKIKAAPINRTTSSEMEEKKEKCPVCKKTFLASEIAAHIKQELANPSTSTVTTAQPEVGQFDFISSNLSNFMNQATNVDREEAKESAPGKERIIWDGTFQSANMVARAAQMQTNQIYQNANSQQPSPFPNSEIIQSSFVPNVPVSHPSNVPNHPAPLIPEQLLVPNPYLAICPIGPIPSQYHAPEILPVPVISTNPSIQSDANLPQPPVIFPFPVSSTMPYPGSIQPEAHFESEPKRQKTLEEILIPAAEFTLAHPGPLTLNIQLPDAASSDRPEWNFDGKIIQLKCTPQESINELKIKIQNATKIPVARQKLFAPNLPPLKNQLSVAYYNLLSETCLALHLKERGGRK